MLRIPAALISIGLIASSAAVASAAWLPNGAPVCTDPGHQFAPAIAPDGAGGVLIAWADLRGVNRPDIYLQRLTSSGDPAPGWPVNGVPACVEVGPQSIPALVPDGAGGAILTWQDGRALDGTSDLYAQHVTASGTLDPAWPATGLPICSAPAFQIGQVMARDGAGGAFVAWEDYRPGPDVRDIYANHVTAAGAIAAGWPADGLGVCVEPDYQGDPRIVADGAGGAIVVWDDRRTGAPFSEDIYALRVTAAGAVAPGWAATGVPLISETGAQIQPMVVPDGAAGAIVVWQDCRVDPEADLYAMRVLASGALAPGWPAGGMPVCVAASAQRQTGMAPDGLGGAFVAWVDGRSGVDDDIYLERMTGAGALAPGWPADGLLMSTRPGYQSTPLLAPDGAGGVFAVWGWGDCCNGEITAQRFLASGAIAPGWTSDGATVRASIGGLFNSPALTADAPGSAVVAWADQRVSFPPFSDIYAYRLVTDGPVPVQVALVSAETGPGFARLVWFAGDGSNLLATVYRRREDTDWEALGTISGDGSGQIVFEDHELSPGRYGYRLGIPQDGHEQLAGEAWVEVPGRTELALEGAIPNPAPRLTVGFQLRDDSPATLEAIDLAGRRVASRDVGDLGPGRHRVDLAEGAPLGPGLYLLVLRQGGRTVTARAAVIR